MIFRVTESMKYGSLTNSLSNVQVKSTSLMEKISTQKNINRPSDDPVGAVKVLKYTSTMSSIGQYQSNISNAQSWLSLTDTNLEGIKDIIAEARGIAVGATDDTKDANATVVTSLIEDALSLMNAKQGDSYIFGGSRTDVVPFASTPHAPSVGLATKGASTKFDGTVMSGGTYTGAEDKTYKVRIVDGGTVAAATYQVSDDNGETWGEEKAFPAQVVQGSMANIANGSPITAATKWDAITGANVKNGTTIDISGVDHDGTSVGPSIFTIADAATGTVQDLLDQIETTFGAGEVTASIDAAGKIKITDKTTGISSLSVSLTVHNPAGPPAGYLNLGMTAVSKTTSITLGDGINMTINDSGSTRLTAGDVFSIPATVAAPSIGTASPATNNKFDGTATSSGNYSGTENKTYAVKIIDAGTLVAATYKISTDGGINWGSEQTFPPKAVQGSVTNTAGGLPITATTVWNTITGANVQNGTTIDISGVDHDGTSVGPSIFTIADAATGTVQDLLDQIETTFGAGEVTASIDTAGKITVTDNTSGQSLLELTLTATNPVGGNLDLGTFASTTSTSIILGDGVTMNFTKGIKDLATNDLFTVNSFIGGYYQGNDDDLTVQVGKNNNFAYNITGSDAFTATNGPAAAASIIGTGAGLTEDSTITLTRGASAGSWTLTSNTQYPNMKIVSQSATEVTIASDGGSTADIQLDLSGNWYTNNTISFSIAKGTTPTVGDVDVSGTGTVDLLTTLNALKRALISGDLATVNALADDLDVAQTQVLQAQTKAGAKAGSLELVSSGLITLNEQITSMKSDIEDADLDKLIISYRMEQIALEASYNLAAQIGKMTILDYLR